MNRNHHSPEFQEQALSKLRSRGTRSVHDVAEELHMSAGTLRKWWSRSNRSVAAVTPVAELPAGRRQHSRAERFDSAQYIGIAWLPKP